MQKMINSTLSLLLAVILTMTCCCTGFAAELTPSDEITLNELGNSVGIHTELQEAYLNDQYFNIADYADGTEELSKPVPITFSWSVADVIDSNTTSYHVEISENESFENSKNYYSTETSCDVYNLKVATEYYWRVYAETESNTYLSNTSTFSTEKTGPRNLNVSGITNVRDIGGYPTVTGGRVKQGMLIRCGRLHESDGTARITRAGVNEMVNNLGIRSEIDLRTAHDGDNGGVTESVLGGKVKYFACPMDYHGNMLTDDLEEDNLESIRMIFKILSDEKNYPVIFHCSIGTDRTGMMAYIFEGLLGVSETDIFRDYLFSNFGKIGSDRSVSSIRKKYPAIFKNTEGNTLAESIYNYLTETVKVPAEQIDSFIRINTEAYDCSCGVCYKGGVLFKGDISEASVTPPKSHNIEGEPISNEKEFLSMKPNGEYFLTSDIKLSESYKGNFTGKLDGNGHTLTVSAPVFEQFSGDVIYLSIDGGINADTEMSGALAVIGKDVYVKNVISNADISSNNGSDIGGLIGTVTGRSRFICCTNNGSITTTGNEGGIVGNNLMEFTAEKCINNGQITNSSPITSNCVGGIVGCSTGSVFLQNCENRVSISARGSKANSIAGDLNNKDIVNTSISNLDNGEEAYVCVCDHLCHKGGIAGMIWKIIALFMKLFKAYPYCDCGALHYT